MMLSRLACPASLLSCLTLLSTAAPSAALTLKHDAVGCMVAEAHPRIEARFDPPADVVRARVQFYADDHRVWYAVAMQREGDRFVALLPRPLKTTGRVTYQVVALDQKMQAAQTAELSAKVAAAGDCEGSGELLTTARVVVLAATGAGLPAGFSTGGVTLAPLGAGAAAGGGGLSTGLIVGAAGAAAAAAGAIVVAGGGEDDTLTGTWRGPYTMTIFNLGIGIPNCTLVFDETWQIVQDESRLTITVTSVFSSATPTSCAVRPEATRRYDTQGTLGAGGAVTVAVQNPNCPALTGSVQGARMTLTTGCPGSTTEIVELTRQ